MSHSDHKDLTSCAAALIKRKQNIHTRATTPAGIAQLEWNNFAATGQGSYLSSLNYLRFASLKSRLLFKVKNIVLEIYRGDVKIGQAGVTVKNNTHIFIDRLQIAPAFEGDWREVFLSILQTLGPGRYQYGGEWNIEPARESLIAQLPGVSIGNVRPITIQYIDFSRFADWGAYYSAISSNCKRNSKCAEKDFPGIIVTESNGISSISRIISHLKMRSLIHNNKLMALKHKSAIYEYIKHALTFGNNSKILQAKHGNRVLASIRTINFGDNVYYLDGGREIHRHGASWLLMIEALRLAFGRNARGKFVMGYVDYATHDEAVGGGLLRSRRALRVSDQVSSIVEFTYFLD
jgi:hypothetical protein